MISRFSFAVAPDFFPGLPVPLYHWTTIFSEHDDDGETDELLFKTVPVSYGRMLGIQRGTEWGFSLWECEMYGKRAEEYGSKHKGPRFHAALSSVNCAYRDFCRLRKAANSPNNPIPKSATVDGSGTGFPDDAATT